MRIHFNLSQMQIVISDLFYKLIHLWYYHSGMSKAHKDSNLSRFWLNYSMIRLFQRVVTTHSPGGKVQVGGAALAHGGERGGSFAYRSLSGPLTHFHCLSFFENYHFLNCIGHVRGNFNLKTMAARVGSSPSVTAPKLVTGLGMWSACWLVLLIEIFLLSYCITY